jgi:hypothetical protein
MRRASRIYRAVLPNGPCGSTKCATYHDAHMPDPALDLSLTWRRQENANANE